MLRRNFIKKSTIAGAGIGLLRSIELNGKDRPDSAPKSVNGKRIESRIMELAKFGKDSLGRGYRVAYTQGDIAGRTWFMDLMTKAGLKPVIDAGGNIIGKRAGMDPNLKPIAFGSHIDMVPDGGTMTARWGRSQHWK